MGYSIGPWRTWAIPPFIRRAPAGIGLDSSAFSNVELPYSTDSTGEKNNDLRRDCCPVRHRFGCTNSRRMGRRIGLIKRYEAPVRGQAERRREAKCAFRVAKAISLSRPLRQDYQVSGT